MTCPCKFVDIEFMNCKKIPLSRDHISTFFFLNGKENPIPVHPPMTLSKTHITRNFLIFFTGLLACPSTTYVPNAAYYTQVNSTLWNGGQSCGQTYSLICDPSQIPTGICTTAYLEVVINGGCLYTGCPTFLLSLDVFTLIASPEATLAYLEYYPPTY